MITTGRTAPPRPRQFQLHLLSPPPFPLTASISVFYGAQRLHLFEGPTKNAVHKTENCRIWWHGPGQSAYTSSVLNAWLRSAGSFVLRLHAVPEMYLSKFIVAIWYLMCFYDAWRTTHRRTDTPTQYAQHSTRSKLKGKEAASAVVVIVAGMLFPALAKSKWLQMCHVKIVIKFELKIRNMPRKTHGKQNNWRAGGTEREEIAALMYVEV